MQNALYIAGSRVDPEGGTLKIVTGSDPGAGAESTVTVPAGKAWEVLSYKITLVTDATVANRRNRLILDDGATEFARFFSLLVQPASLTWTHTFAKHGAMNGGAADALANINPFPDVILGPGYRIITSTVAIQAGDNYGVPALLVVEYDVGD